jgi:hypothetical protein
MAVELPPHPACRQGRIPRLSKVQKPTKPGAEEEEFTQNDAQEQKQFTHHSKKGLKNLRANDAQVVEIYCWGPARSSGPLMFCIYYSSAVQV